MKYIMTKEVTCLTMDKKGNWKPYLLIAGDEIQIVGIIGQFTIIKHRNINLRCETIKIEQTYRNLDAYLELIN